MTTLKYGLLGAFSVIVLLVIIGFFLPSTVAVERSVEINVPVNKVYAQVVEFKNWPNWDPWSKKDPNIARSYPTGSKGEGAMYEWKSDHKSVGNGSQLMVEAIENESIRTELRFDGQGEANSHWQFEASGGITKVTWGFRTDFGLNVFGRYMGLAFEEYVAKDYEKGLARLKNYCESGSAE